MEESGTRGGYEGGAAVVADRPGPWGPAKGPGRGPWDYPESWTDESWTGEDLPPAGGQAWDEAQFWAGLEEDLAGEPPAGHVSEELAAGLGVARRGLARTALTQEERTMLLGASVGSGLEQIADLATQLDATTYGLVAQALERGLHTEVGLGLVDWIRVRIPRMSAREAAEHAAIAQVSRRSWAQVLGEAMAAGKVALHRAAKVARTMRRLTTSLDGEALAAFTQIATEAACDPKISDTDLDIVCARLIELLLAEKEPGDRERAAWELRTVFTKKLGLGMTRFVIDAPAAAAAVLNGILTSELAAPRPDAEGNPDMRFPGQRRFDALMAVINRGLSDPGAPPSRARAAVILTVPVDPATSAPTGPMTSPTGDYVPPRQAALMACTADLLPVWVSAQGEPLRLGREQRYATPEQWKALVVRDRHCTFPGCTVPPQWCDSHHIIWWSRHGDTDILNLALLCGQHHTFVHLHDLTATIIGGVVVWHL